MIENIDIEKVELDEFKGHVASDLQIKEVI